MVLLNCIILVDRNEFIINIIIIGISVSGKYINFKKYIVYREL